MKIQKSEKGIWVYFLVFFLCCAMKCLYLMGMFNMRLPADSYGGFFLASVLSGRDWGDLIHQTAYYGQVYYVLFTPLFWLTKNPYVIYYVICFVNIGVIGLTSVLVYHIFVKYINVADKRIAVALALLSSGYCTNESYYYSDNPAYFMNEVPALLAVWLTVFLIVKCYFNRMDGKRSIGHTILLVFVLCWAVLVHSRLLAIWPVVGCVVLLYFLIKRRWIVHPITFFTGSLLGICISQVFKKVLIAYLWGTGDRTLHNSVLITSTVERTIYGNISLKSIVDVTLSNFYKLTLDTYGLFPICIAVVIILCWRILSNVKNKDGYSMNQTDELAVLLLLIYGILLVGTVCGIWMNFGTAITQNTDYESANHYYRFFYYIRYYFIYFGPILCSSIYLLVKHIEWFRKRLDISVYSCIIFSTYVMIFVLPRMLGDHYNKFILGSFLKGETHKANFGITILILVVFVLLGCFLIKKGKTNLFLYPVLLVTILSGWNISGDSFFKLLEPKQGGAAIYEILTEAGEAVNIPENIYVSDNIDALRSLQFMLNKCSIKYGMPDEEEEQAMVFTSSFNQENIDYLLRQGYQVYHLDSMEYLWIRGKELQECLQPFIVDYLMKQKDIPADCFVYSDTTVKIGKFIYQMREGRTVYSKKNPVDGTYQLDYTIEPVYSKEDEFGYIEVFLDEQQVLQYPLCISEIMDDGHVKKTFNVNNNETLEISVVLYEHVFVKRMQTSITCLDSTRQFGINAESELAGIKRVMSRIDSSYPIYIISCGDTYQKDSDFSYAEKVLNKKIEGVIPSAQSKTCTKNGFILLEKDEKNKLIFELVDNYEIIYCTSNYTLLLYKNERNANLLKQNEIEPLSNEGKINIDFFRMRKGRLYNDVENYLNAGMYQVEIETSKNRWNQKCVQLNVEVNGSVYKSTNNNESAALFWADDETAFAFNLYDYYTVDRNDYVAYISKWNTPYQSGDNILFSDRNTQCYTTNLSGAEVWGRWSLATENQIIIPVSYQESITVDLGVRSFQGQQISIYAGDIFIGEYSIGMNSMEISMDIPQEALIEDYLVLNIISEDTWNIDAYLHSGDERNVGLGFEYLEIK